MMEARAREVRFRGRKAPAYEDVILSIWSDYELGKSKQEIANKLVDLGLSQRVAMAYVKKYIASIHKQQEAYGSLLSPDTLEAFP